MSKEKKYYGVSTCVNHKTINFLEKEAQLMPCLERAGACGLCFWFDEKQEALNKIEDLIKLGYFLNSIHSVPSHYLEKEEFYYDESTK